jgi:hypothetical protein
MSFQDIALFLSWLGDMFFAGFVITAIIGLTVFFEGTFKRL